MDCKASFDNADKRIDIIAPNTFQLFAILNYISSRDYGHYDIMLKQFDISKPGLVVDIGAALGQSVLLYSPVLGNNREFLCIEPADYNLKYLRENTRQYNVEIVKAACGASNRSVNIAFPGHEQRNRRDIEGNSGLITCYGTGRVLETTNLQLLDDIVGDRKVFFLDLDVEGMEMEVLFGAQKMIARDRPYIHAEIGLENQRMAGRSKKEVYNMIIGMGYKIKAVQKENYFFVPKE
jgi:FkbM family methyltransferase